MGLGNEGGRGEVRIGRRKNSGRIEGRIKGRKQRREGEEKKMRGKDNRK